jgi:YegS/Rv2252/BmrU family lipid kinase
MKITVIINPAAGFGGFQKLVRKAIQYLVDQGHAVEAVETSGPGHATHLARRAVEAQVEVAVAVGGDGTINEVCNGLAGSGTALGVLPAGTANVYAADMRIPIWWPLKPDAVFKAADIITCGQQRRIDLGRVRFPDGRSRYFLMWCGIGLDAAISQGKRRREKGKRSLGYAAWVISGVLTTIDFMGTSAILQTDYDKIYDRLLLAVVSNGQLYGRLWRMAPKAKMDDGMLDVGVLTGHGWPVTIRHVVGLTFRQHVRDPNFRLYRTTRLSLTAREPLPVHVDAETIGTTPVEVEIAPQVLKIMVPHNAPKRLFLQEP